MNTQECRVKANWRQIGKSVYTLPKFVYRVPCNPVTRLVEHLGAIKKRSDGRWNWWRFRSTSHTSWGEGQGATLTQGAAELRVLEGWETEDEMSVERMREQNRGSL